MKRKLREKAEIAEREKQKKLENSRIIARYPHIVSLWVDLNDRVGPWEAGLKLRDMRMAGLQWASEQLGSPYSNGNQDAVWTFHEGTFRFRSDKDAALFKLFIA